MGRELHCSTKAAKAAKAAIPARTAIPAKAAIPARAARAAILGGLELCQKSLNRGLNGN